MILFNLLGGGRDFGLIQYVKLIDNRCIFSKWICPSGYQAAILGELVKEVFTIEIIPELGGRSQKLLKELGYKNIKVRVGDGYQGWPGQAPFDAVIVTAAPPKIPRPLLEQFKIGGRMIIPVGNKRQELVLIRRNEKGYEQRSVLPVAFVPMTGEAQEKPRAGNFR